MSESSDSAAEITVILPADLHARPAGRLAKTAAGFESVISLEYGGRIINPTGVLSVMGLGATAGSTMTIRAEGSDADSATRALAQVLAESQ
jgi:phosphotransferase system HPr (HPr) family protein